MSRYNGWTNYATWRVNLELLADYIDGMELSDFEDASELVPVLEGYVDEMIDQYGPGLANDYARAFLADVNYFEVAVTALGEHAPDVEPIRWQKDID